MSEPTVTEDYFGHSDAQRVGFKVRLSRSMSAFPDSLDKGAIQMSLE